ncbi:MAG TPA: ATP-dependent Clp protease proteolytic subunit [Acidimicrobiales bacterium]|nr:ATP-dependent Clp protease proteolytic subunit [Acidimicrobiales bacterium]
MTNPEHWPEIVRARLFDERKIQVFGYLDEARVSEIAAELWTLDALGDDPVTLFLSCRGGSVAASLAMIDVLDVVGVDVHAVCIGGAEGPPVAVLSAATKRSAAPNARFVLRDEQASIEGPFRSLEQSSRRLQDERRELLERLASSTNGRHSLGDLLTDFDRGLALSAPEARRYGLIDEVLSSGERIVQLNKHSPEIGFRRPPRGSDQ